MITKKLKPILLLTALLFSQCIDDPINTKEGDKKILDRLYENIEDQANNISCIDNEDEMPPTQRGYSFVAIGSKACGGPAGYMIYSNAIDKAAFLKKVREYTNAEKQYNKRWQVTSTCEAILEPKDVECINGKPKLIY